MNGSSLSHAAKQLLPERIRREIKVACGVPDTEACLARLKRCGFRPTVAIDVGAYSGEWTRSLLRLFPGTRVLMIEPQETMRPQLSLLASSCPGLELAATLLGPHSAGSVGFFESATASSVLQDENHHEPPSTFLPMTTLDAIVGKKRFPAPDLIKLDVQGYEIEILKGAGHSLNSVEVVQMEVNLIPIYQGAPLAHEAIQFMAGRGFQVYDIGAFFRRPFDNALWQMDVFFARSSSALLASKRWS